MNPIRQVEQFLDRRRAGRPGESSMRRFRIDRRRKLLDEWRFLAGMLAYAAGAALLTAITSGAARLVFAALVGSALTLLLFFWAIGDVHSLVWAWGSIGEQQTADLLAQLPDEWTCEHDVPTGEGSNWDHILVGPAGVFAIDSKNLTRSAIAAGDELRSGRVAYAGAAFRGNAFALHRALQAERTNAPFVQAVVVIWGEFPQRSHEEKNVVYLHSGELLPWLRERTPRLAPARTAELAAAVKELRHRS